MIVQFSITGKSGAKITYKRSTRLGKFFRNNIEVSEAEYNKALEYFQSN